MEVAELLIFFLILLAASLFTPALSRWVRLPVSTLLVIIGFAGSEIFIAQGGDTGIRASNFQPLIFYIFLPILIFDSAYHLNSLKLIKNMPTILWMAIMGMAFTALLTAVGVYFGINHPTGFPWTTALVAGALLAATDPVAVVSQIKSHQAPEQLEILLEGESLFNDATAVVLFTLFIGLATTTGNGLSTGSALGSFAQLFVGGIALGIVLGFIATLISKLLKDSYSHSLLTLLTAYGAFFVGEHWLHVSGIMTVLVAGLILGSSHNRQLADPTNQALQNLWGLLGRLGNNLVFLLMGVTVSLAMFTERWLAILIAIGAVILARIISIALSLGAARITPGGEPVSWQNYPVIVWGGLRGVIAIALALSLPTELEGWWTVQAIAFGVVVFSLFIQAPTCGLLIRRAKNNS